jgi:hypothetical protein
MKTTAAQYREFAAQCEQLAQDAQHERHRSILVEMAQVWRKFAAQDDRSSHGSSP